MVFGSIGNRFKSIGDLIESLDNVTQDINSRSQLSQRILGFHGGGDDGNVDALGTDSMIERHTGNIDIYE